MNKIVWDLFGGLNGSVRKALNKELYDIYTFDILPKTKDGKSNIILDLTDNNIITTLKNMIYNGTIKYPDIIVASPMCMSFSWASALKNGSTGWIINEDKSISLRPESDFLNKDINGWKDPYKKGWRYKFIPSRKNALLGAKAITNTLNIIASFKPKHWYIENPQRSLIWNYIQYNLKVDGFKNVAHYGAYNASSKKPTTFFSNTNLNLKKVDEKSYRSAKNWEMISRKDRSDIPSLLLEDIFKQFEL